MNILLVDSKKNTCDILVRKLFPMGITVFQKPDLTDIINFIGENEIKLLILDIDINPKESINLLNTIGKLPIKPVRTVISSITDKKIIMMLVSSGIAGYFLKPFTEDTGFPKLLEILRKINDFSGKRTYYRVSPGADEETRVFLRLSNNPRLVSGNLLNISAGGLAISLSEEITDEEMNDGDFIQKIQFKLDNQDLSLSGKVVFKKVNVFAISLQNCSEQDLAVVSKYIFRKISETT